WKVIPKGTVSLVKDIDPGALGSDPGPMVFPTGSATSPGYFAATTVANGRELWKTDGTSAGTVLVKDILSGVPGSMPINLVAGASRVYFRAFAPDTGNELYISDGTSDGTVLHADINSGAADSDPSQLTQLTADTIVFTADDGSHGDEVWVTTPA